MYFKFDIYVRTSAFFIINSKNNKFIYPYNIYMDQYLPIIIIICVLIAIGLIMSNNKKISTNSPIIQHMTQVGIPPMCTLSCPGKEPISVNQPKSLTQQKINDRELDTSIFSSYPPNPMPSTGYSVPTYPSQIYSPTSTDYATPMMPPSITPQPIPSTTQSIAPPISSQSNIWLSEHNKVRAEVGQSPVIWNDTIAAGALEYANVLANQKNCRLEHSGQSDRRFGNSILGENLAQGYPASMYDDKKMANLWEDEKRFYRYPQLPSQGTGGETGHYTQMINKNVKQIGCGCANCGNNGRVCVCRYDPIQMGNEPPY